MADHVETALAQLSRAFTVRDIMTPCAALVGAANANDARALSEEKEYDVIIYPESAVVPTGYFYRGGDLQMIELGDIVSDGTSLLDAIDLLEEKKRRERGFFFVLTSDKISGFVHFSDLNKSLVKTAFYMMIEATERHMLGVLRAVLADEQALEDALTPASKGHIQKLLADAKKKAANPNMWDVLGWPHILQVARVQGLLRKSSTEQLTIEEEKLLKAIRDRVAHTGQLLVDDYDKVHSLIETRRFCTALREWNKIPAS